MWVMNIRLYKDIIFHFEDTSCTTENSENWTLIQNFIIEEVLALALDNFVLVVYKIYEWKIQDCKSWIVMLEFILKPPLPVFFQYLYRNIIAYRLMNRLDTNKCSIPEALSMFEFYGKQEMFFEILSKREGAFWHFHGTNTLLWIQATFIDRLWLNFRWKLVIFFFQ